MCGISGAIRWPSALPSTPDTSTALTAIVRRMSDAQRHRGPDGSGLWQSAGQEVTFGHRRLAIIDLSEGGAQPMIDTASGVTITFNGEIYNFGEIRRELETHGATFRSASDTEVILKAYRQWGIDGVARFRGIFAFALWDPGARRVHIVRDPLGIKPLYFTRVRDAAVGDVLLFASEVRSLLASEIVPRTLDPRGVASYLWNGFVTGPETMIRGVQLLPAASILTIDVDAPAQIPSPRQYWHLPASGDRRYTAEELKEELRRTVAMQLISDVPLGVFLSGGIDSSAVAALASEVAPGSVHTFTIGFDVPQYDESRYAQAVAKHLRTEHATVMLTEHDFEAQLPDAFTAIDQPTFDGINTYFVSRAAREAGMTVALAGTGGDELFGGYPTFTALPQIMRAGRWIPQRGVAGSVVSGAVTAAARSGNAVAFGALHMAPPQTRWGKLADVIRASGDLAAAYQVNYMMFTRETQHALTTGAVHEAQRAQDYGLNRAMTATWRQRANDPDMLHAISLLELSGFIGERLLRDTDAASMAVALEVRVPLLDHVLVETVSGIEPGRRFSPLGKKQLLRDCALSALPPGTFDRPKSGFVLPIDTWARQRLQPAMGKMFDDTALAARIGLNGETVKTLWRSFTAGRAGIHWTRVWALYVLMKWCEEQQISR
ncbi:MAG: asparagine synthase (glutamine-hydrolyzing) [Acidobacteria bacterium]|nr:asparagine synthase (glutamine-hydrolyzing) [Acidobacteriota bacterium]